MITLRKAREDAEKLAKFADNVWQRKDATTDTPRTDGISEDDGRQVFATLLGVTASAPAREATPFDGGRVDNRNELSDVEAERMFREALAGSPAQQRAQAKGRADRKDDGGR